MKNEKEKIKLVLISPEMRNRIMEYRASFLDNGEKIIHGSCALHDYEVFDEWYQALRNPAEGLVPSSNFIALRLPDNTIVGMTGIRHYLTDAIYRSGHIGYSVRPEERGKGYGTEILRQALIKADQLGIIETVVSCNADNKASRRVIAHNKMQFQQQFIEDNGNTVLIYTI